MERLRRSASVGWLPAAGISGQSTFTAPKHLGIASWLVSNETRQTWGLTIRVASTDGQELSPELIPLSSLHNENSEYIEVPDQSGFAEGFNGFGDEAIYGGGFGEDILGEATFPPPPAEDSQDGSGENDETDGDGTDDEAFSDAAVSSAAGDENGDDGVVFGEFDEANGTAILSIDLVGWAANNGGDVKAMQERVRKSFLKQNTEREDSSAVGWDTFSESVTRRAPYALEAGFGVLEAVAGYTIGVGGGFVTFLAPPAGVVTVPASVFGFGLGANGVDHLVSGFRKLLGDEDAETLTTTLAREAAGEPGTHFKDLLELSTGTAAVPPVVTRLKSGKKIAEVAETTTEAATKASGKTRALADAAEEAVEKAAPRVGLRQQYTDAVAGLKGIGDDLLRQGLPKEDVARRLHAMRRQLGGKFKDMTPPDLLEYIHKFNIDRYGDKLGPTFESLIAKGKTFDQIIGSASRPLGDVKQLGAALHKHFGDEILPLLKKYDMLP